MIISQLVPRFVPSIGGMEVLSYETAKFMLLNGNQVKIFTSKYGKKNNQDLPRKEIVDGLNVLRSKSFPLWPKNGGSLNVMPKMIFDILHDKSDIYHTYGAGSFPSLIGTTKFHNSKIIHTPVLFNQTENGLLENIVNMLAKTVLKKAHKIIALTNSERDFLRGLGIEKEKIKVVPPYANYDRFKKFFIKSEDFKKKYNFSKYVIYYCGRIDNFQKGLDNLVKSLKYLQDLDVTLVISGEDWGSKETLIKIAKELNVLDKIKFFSSNDQFLGEAYHGSDVFVLPSNFEPFGQVLIESMCCGTPVIGTKVGGIVDVIKHEKTGLLVPPKDPKSLADAIYDILTNDKKRNFMKENAIKERDVYSVKKIGNDILNIYKDCFND